MHVQGGEKKYSGVLLILKSSLRSIFDLESKIATPLVRAKSNKTDVWPLSAAKRLPLSTLRKDDTQIHEAFLIFGGWQWIGIGLEAGGFKPSSDEQTRSVDWRGACPPPGHCRGALEHEVLSQCYDQTLPFI